MAVPPHRFEELTRIIGEAARQVSREFSDAHPEIPWHRSGTSLAFHALRDSTSWDLMILPMEGDASRGSSPRKPTTFLSTPVSELYPMFSPDGRWIAYQSNESGGIFDI